VGKSFLPPLRLGMMEVGVAGRWEGAKRLMSVFLEPVSGKGLKIPLDKAIIFIGRHPDCDVVITRSRMISRKHCALVQINNSLVIRDLGSTNGVRVNGQRVKKDMHFVPGDTVTIGDIDYLVRSVKTPEPERRANRDHPQDARSAGAIPLRMEPAIRNESIYSQEIPVAIPEDEEMFEEIESDTPDSYPVIPTHEGESDEAGHPAELSSPGRSPLKTQRIADDDDHLPLTD
jgi:predicted component of type VI protein secretion system